MADRDNKTIPAVAAPIREVLSEVVCGLCGNGESKLQFEESPYRVVRCSSCGLTYVTPRRNAEKLREMYLVDYWKSTSAKDFGYANYLKDEPLYLRTYRRRFKAIRRYFPSPGRVLDVGCAAGYFLSVAKENGWRCTGVEVSGEMTRFARDRYQLDVRQGVLDEHAFDPASFDLITFWDVIEHIPDPRAALAQAHRLLAPGGRLVIETQNVDSRFARFMGRRWHHYKHAEHIYHFNPATVRRLLHSTGFEILNLHSRLGGKFVSFDFIIERASRVHPFVRTLLTPLAPIRNCSIYVNLYDEMIVTAKAR